MPPSLLRGPPGKGQSGGGAFQPADRTPLRSLPAPWNAWGLIGASEAHESWLDDPEDGSCRMVEIPSTYVRLKLGCFNCGMTQEMLCKQSWLAKLRRVIGRGVLEQGLHLLTLCEVGGHLRGMADCRLESAQSLVDPVLSK